MKKKNKKNPNPTWKNFFKSLPLKKQYARPQIESTQFGPGQKTLGGALSEAFKMSC